MPIKAYSISNITLLTILNNHYSINFYLLITIIDLKPIIICWFLYMHQQAFLANGQTTQNFYSIILVLN